MVMTLLVPCTPDGGERLMREGPGGREGWEYETCRGWKQRGGAVGGGEWMWLLVSLRIGV